MFIVCAATTLAACDSGTSPNELRAAAAARQFNELAHEVCAANLQDPSFPVSGRCTLIESVLTATGMGAGPVLIPVQTRAGTQMWGAVGFALISGPVTSLETTYQAFVYSDTGLTDVINPIQILTPGNGVTGAYLFVSDSLAALSTGVQLTPGQFGGACHPMPGIALPAALGASSCALGTLTFSMAAVSGGHGVPASLDSVTIAPQVVSALLLHR